MFNFVALPWLLRWYTLVTHTSFEKPQAHQCMAQTLQCCRLKHANSALCIKGKRKLMCKRIPFWRNVSKHLTEHRHWGHVSIKKVDVENAETVLYKQLIYLENHFSITSLSPDRITRNGFGQSAFVQRTKGKLCFLLKQKANLWLAVWPSARGKLFLF